ncbi:protein FAR1-RELATED SEQUENCE 5-like [Salvia splendens]|uniref:protein FAR1-RELATED SEQUENCE 5-like n=2 Tax=Salvia splendens TaxID=180675 RepID=UPI001C25F12E|nr:protein FAR1-RELATED SEQUENCE 5-like [Salvia splendens]
MPINQTPMSDVAPIQDYPVEMPINHTPSSPEDISFDASSPITDDIVESEGTHTPVCSDEIKPFIGQRFLKLEDATEFYNNYARFGGFDSRRNGSKKSGDVFTWLYMVCSREGERKINEEGFTPKRKRSTKKCSCPARISFKFAGSLGYVVNDFVEGHNHEMVQAEHKHFMRLNRSLDLVHQKFIIDCANANIGPTLSYRLLKELLGGYESVGCTVGEVRNFTRDVRRYADGFDVQMLLNEMQKKKDNCEGFTFEYEKDSGERLTRLFWCDAYSKMSYHMFGDIVAFDTTYSTNRYRMIFAPFTGKDNHGKPITFAAALLANEGTESFSWVFEQFVKCMGSAPKLIITDQDPAMRGAIEQVMSNTRHRWCMWHIMVKLADKVGKDLRADERFKKELNSCVWSELIEPHEFEAAWNEVMNKYGLTGVGWFRKMFATRKMWVPAYFRDFPMSSLIKTTSVSESQNMFFKRYGNSTANLVQFIMNFNHALDAQRNNSAKHDYLDSTTIPILKTKLLFEKHASTIFTENAFKSIQEEMADASSNCGMKGMSTEDDIQYYEVDDLYEKTWTVTFCADDDSYQCSCKLFERIGKICSHIFFILKNNHVKLIPDTLFGGRWLKTPLMKATHGVLSKEDMTYAFADEKKMAIKKLYSSFFELVQAVESDIEKIHAATALIDDAKKGLFSGDVVMSAFDKKKMIESFYGCEKPEEVDVHPPEYVNTKGCGSTAAARLISKKEKAIQLSKKPQRRCAKCKEMGHHDSRNCTRVKEKEKELRQSQRKEKRRRKSQS